MPRKALTPNPLRPVRWIPDDPDVREQLVDFAARTRRSVNAALCHIVATYLADEQAQREASK